MNSLFNQAGLSVSLVRHDDEAFADCLRHEFEVFGLANDYASSADLRAGRMTWYEPYDRSSEFYLARDERGTVTAISRLIRHDPARGIDSFSTVVDGQSYAPYGGAPRCYLHRVWRDRMARTDPATVAELATQAIVPNHRRFRGIDSLWRSMRHACRVEGVELWTMALVIPLFKFYKALVPSAIHAMGDVMPNYIGADSVPAVLLLDHPEVGAYLAGGLRAQAREVHRGSEL